MARRDLAEPASQRAGGVPLPDLRDGGGRAWWSGSSCWSGRSSERRPRAGRARRAAGRRGARSPTSAGPPEGLDTKSSRTDPVSDADREAERAIEELLAAERPEDGLLAEEGARSEGTSGRRWIVDPLDGTVNFLYGFPVWGVSVALEDEEGMAVGVVYDPTRDETFRAVRGEGAELNGRPLRVRERRELRAAAGGAPDSATTAERRAAQARADRPAAARGARHPPGRRRRPRPRLAGRRARGRVPRARPEALGLGRGAPARGGGRRRGGAARRPAGAGGCRHARAPGGARGSTPGAASARCAGRR